MPRRSKPSSPEPFSSERQDGPPTPAPPPEPSTHNAPCSRQPCSASLTPVPHPFHQRARHSNLPALGLVAACFCVLPAHALNRITLRNGFTYDCARQQAIDTTHTRLFLTETAESSYLDIPTAQIVAVDALPPPPLPIAASPAKAGPDIPTLLSAAGAQHNIDVELLASLVHAESSGHARAVSRTGAQGLMQLMPGTARTLGVKDSLQPDQNINGGTTYLDWLLTRYRNNLALALAAYNAGPGAVDRFGGIPPYRETRAYVVRVMTEFKRRKEALTRKPSTGTLQASR